MTGAQKAILFLNSFGSGVLAPVLSLFLLAHGCGLQSLALVIGLYSATVVLFEVPSGLYADMRGRKNAFFLSCGFTALAFGLLYGGAWALLPGMALLGLGRAFLSGSLESLILEDCAQRGGDGALAKAAGTNLVCQCAGIAAGALAGGFLPAANGYAAHVAVRLGALLLTGLLCARFVRENRAPAQGRPSLSRQVRLVKEALYRKRPLRIVLLCVFGGSVALFALETYWQPAVEALNGPRYLLGVTCACGYGGSMLGSLAAGRLPMKEAKSRWRFYLAFVALFGLALCLLALQRSALAFSLCYVLALTALGFANVPEQTLLNGLATGENRASLLSVSSLFSQLGAMAGGVACTALIAPLQIPGVMLAAGTFAALTAVAAAVLRPCRP